MKTIIKVQILTVILISMFFGALAQQSNSENSGSNNRNVWFGLKLGTDLTAPTTSFEVIKSQLNSNMQIGAFVKIGKKVFLQPEIYGNILVENEEINSPKFVANSVRVPVLLGFDFLDLKIASAHFMAGPMATYYLNPTTEQKYDYKLQIGGGVELLRFVTLDVRYAVALNNDIQYELQQLRWNSKVNVTLGIQLR